MMHDKEKSWVGGGELNLAASFNTLGTRTSRWALPVGNGLGLPYPGDFLELPGRTAKIVPLKQIRYLISAFKKTTLPLSAWSSGSLC